MAVVREFSSRGKRATKALSAGIEGLLSAGVRGSIDVPVFFPCQSREGCFELCLLFMHMM